jgi:excinuclease ABC subunit A
MKAAWSSITGPEAGTLWWQSSGSRNIQWDLKCESLTAKYLNGDLEITVPKSAESSKLCGNKGARENNLQNIDVVFH